MFKNKKIFIIIVLFFGINFSHAFNIKKVETPTDKNDFVLFPAKTEIEILPGERVIKEFTVTNRSTEKADFSIEFEGLEQPEDPFGPANTVPGDRRASSALKFLDTEIEEFTLSPGEQATFFVSVGVPGNTKPGSYSGVILVSSSFRGFGGGTNHIISRVGSLIFIKVPFTYGEALEDSGDYLDVAHKDGKFLITFDNKGETVLNPYGIIEINSIWGETLEKVAIDPWYILQGTKRAREISWNKKAPFPYYSIKALMYPGYGGMENIKEFNFKILSDNFYGIVIIIMILIVTIIVFALKLKKKIKNNKK